LPQLLPAALLFPYTTLFRSDAAATVDQREQKARAVVEGQPADLIGSDAHAQALLERSEAARVHADERLLAELGHAPGQIVLRIRSEEHTSELQSRENLVCRL